MARALGILGVLGLVLVLPLLTAASAIAPIQVAPPSVTGGALTITGSKTFTDTAAFLDGGVLEGRWKNDGGFVVYNNDLGVSFPGHLCLDLNADGTCNSSATCRVASAGSSTLVCTFHLNMSGANAINLGGLTVGAAISPFGIANFISAINGTAGPTAWGTGHLTVGGSTTTSAALGLSYDTTNDAAQISSLAPNSAWKPLKLRGLKVAVQTNQANPADAVVFDGVNSTIQQVNTSALPTCNSGNLHLEVWDSTGDTGGKESKPCVCEKASDGTTFRWRNRFNALASALGNTTTCPDTT